MIELVNPSLDKLQEALYTSDSFMVYVRKMSCVSDASLVIPETKQLVLDRSYLRGVDVVGGGNLSMAHSTLLHAYASLGRMQLHNSTALLRTASIGDTVCEHSVLEAGVLETQELTEYRSLVRTLNPLGFVSDDFIPPEGLRAPDYLNLDTNLYRVGFNPYSGILQIGCQGHRLSTWEMFTEAEIYHMDGVEAVNFWSANKDAILYQCHFLQERYS